MINIHDNALLDLTFGRRGEGWRTHDRPIHRAGYALFHPACGFFCHRQIGYDAHRPDHLTEGEEQHQGDVLHINSSNHGWTIISGTACVAQFGFAYFLPTATGRSSPTAPFSLEKHQ